MNHFATPRFWYHYRQLPAQIAAIADKNFELLRANEAAKKTIFLAIENA